MDSRAVQIFVVVVVVIVVVVVVVVVSIRLSGVILKKKIPKIRFDASQVLFCFLFLFCCCCFVLFCFGGRGNFV